MISQQLDAEVIRNENISGNIFRLTLNWPGISSLARPGQFVMIKASAKNTPLLRRPFSVYQATGNDRLQILFKVLGKGTGFLAERKKGDLLNVVGPLGRGFAFTGEETNVCLVGGGMGIAPLFFLAKKLCRQHTSLNNIQVLLGAATAAEILPLKADFDQLGLNTRLSTDDGSTGHHGLITDLLDLELDGKRTWSLAVCGPHAMMRKIVKTCKKNSWPCQASLETLMACGIAACLGCAVKASGAGGKRGQYLHVCKDGPVFDAGEILWE